MIMLHTLEANYSSIFRILQNLNISHFGAHFNFSVYIVPPGMKASESHKAHILSLYQNIDLTRHLNR